MKITLKAARINAGLQQTDMSYHLGVSRKTVSAWENGKSMPTVNKIDAICELLRVSYDDIIWKI